LAAHELPFPCFAPRTRLAVAWICDDCDISQPGPVSIERRLNVITESRRHSTKQRALTRRWTRIIWPRSRGLFGCDIDTRREDISQYELPRAARPDGPVILHRSRSR
jgi:hypothetical protein